MVQMLLLLTSALFAFSAIARPSPTWTYKSDCFKSKPVVGLLQYVPGAGIEEFKPFDTVEKDGFSEIDCVKDYMYNHGDKFGAAKHDYKLEEVSNVSIVHYDAHVKKEDRQPMTQDRCFEFCRTVPNMGFFGLLNGRNCYCAPYYKQMAGDSSQCDATCPGDSTMMCGGKAKSSIFSMHNCDSTGRDLGNADDKAEALAETMDDNIGKAGSLSDDMQANAAALQKSFGAVGDSGATDLMQKAKVAAGKLAEAAKGVAAISKELKGHSSDAKKITDFKDAKQVTEAERIMERVDATVAKGKVANAALEKLIDLASPSPDKEGSAKMYMSVMHFVDSKYEASPSTCNGDTVNDPITGESVDGCASACNANFQKCVGFQYFADEKLCFLFSSFDTATYYTGCKSFLQKPAFLQKADAKVCCYAKVSKFEGTTLKPDASGKCKECFKKATKADRCW